MVRGCLQRQQCSQIKMLFAGIHRSGKFPWYTYEPGRDMMPMHASPALDSAATERVLRGLEVFGPPDSLGADPVHGWPRLCELLASGAEGARELEALQQFPQEAIGDFAKQPCLFIQAQMLESGAEVTPHRDALPYGGDLIATVVVEGGTNRVRVGRVQFDV